jgi:hypothetical protein
MMADFFMLLPFFFQAVLSLAYIERFVTSTFGAGGVSVGAALCRDLIEIAPQRRSYREAVAPTK